MATYLVHLLDGHARKVDAENVGYNLETSMFEASSASGVVFMAPRDQVRSVELADPELVVNVCLTEDQVRAVIGQVIVEERQWSRPGVRL
ncbi:hypothetical protein [Streptomyces rochei]|uniref:hypothetical protein n=1 Tax=Streptomyces rochei TaxID=1928 RepID=UPI0036A3291D